MKFMRTQPKPIVTIVKQQIEELKADAQADQQSSERELEASTRHKESSKRKMIRAAELEKLVADIRGNIEREVKARSMARTKTSVMNALVEAATFDVPKALIESESEERVAAARAELKQRGVPNADSMPIPADAFTAEAERRVRLGLLVSELVTKESLQAKPEQVRARIEEFAANYEKPAEVVSYYLADRARRAEVEGIVLEDNVVQHALAKAQVEDEAVPFDQIMGTA